MRAETGQPLSRLWSEYITARPTGNPVTNAILLGIAVWTSGLVSYALIGVDAAVSYIEYLPVYGWLVYVPLMVFGMQYFHRSYMKEVEEFRPHLEISDEAFGALLRRLDFLVCNRWVVFISALVLTGYFEWTNTSPTPFYRFATQVAAGSIPTIDIIWGTALSYLNWLLLSTAIWLVVSIWIGVFIVSRRPLNFTPARFSNEFHGLAILNLATTGFYFLGLAIPGILNYFAQASKHFDIFSLTFFYVLIGLGAVGFFAPHYNIHRTLVKGKNEELARIDKEMTQYASRLHELALNKSEELQEYVKLSSRLIALGANERRIAEADNWPLDHGQISTFLILIVIPIILNLITNPLP